MHCLIEVKQVVVKVLHLFQDIICIMLCCIVVCNFHVFIEGVLIYAPVITSIWQFGDCVENIFTYNLAQCSDDPTIVWLVMLGWSILFLAWFFG